MARFVLIVAALALTALAPPAAWATPPGANGKIAFSLFGEIYTVEPDGSGLRQIVRPGEVDKLDWYPAWSPDGTKLATFGDVFERDAWGNRVRSTKGALQVFGADGSGFTRFDTPRQHFSGQASWSPYGDEIAYASDVVGNSSIYIVGADGSNPRVVVPGAHDRGASDPAWSPDGRWIAFARQIDEHYGSDLYLVRPDGSDLHRILERPGQELGPSWSPDGRTLVFTGSGPRVVEGASSYHSDYSLYTVPAAGGAPTRLTTAEADGSPAWSPDGRMIAFQRHVRVPEATNETRLWVMNADGGNQRVLVDERCLQCDPDWQRVPPFGDPPPPRPTANPAGTPTPTPYALEIGQHPSTRPPVTPLARVKSVTLSRTRFSWRGRLNVYLSLKLTREAHVTFRVVRGRRVLETATRAVPAGPSRLALRTLLPRRLRPGSYHLTLRTANRETRRAFRIVR